MARSVLSVEQYLAEVLALVRPLPDIERVPVREASGRTLAEPVLARGDVPAFANSAMDGYAVRTADLAPGVMLHVAGEVLAGSAEDPVFGPCACVRIMTGAPLPSGADAVVPVEQTTPVEGGVRIDEVVVPGRHVRRAGEDLRAGDVVLEAGVRLGPRELSAAAAAGVPRLVCARRPVIGVVATGDELVAAGEPLARGQIHESNGTFLAAAIERDGGVPIVVDAVADAPEAFAAALDQLADECDVIVVSGGVSVGDADVTRIVLESAGASFRHVRMQPGKPQGWARWGATRTAVVALPGNPLSAAVSYEMFVVPLIDRLHDRPTPGWSVAQVVQGWSGPQGRRQLIPVLLDVDETGRQLVKPAHRRGSASHMVTSLAAANALASVSEDVSSVAPGDLVAVRRLP